MTCCTLPDLERFASDALRADDSAGIEAHVLRCAACSERLEEVRANVLLIAELSSADLNGAGSNGTAAPLDERPASIGSYEIVREIGRGGMGIVYEAVQRDPPRPVAIKVLNDAAAHDVHAAERFRLEARALAMLPHPGIATIHEAGCTPDGRPFLAMELIDGTPLCRFARERDLSIDARLRLFMQVCDAVSAAHQRGVLHLDLKPGNVLVKAPDAAGSESSGSSPKVLDFGLARIVTDQRSSGVAGSARVFGTPAYMSPEQAAAQTDALDVRSDVYSLGVVLYELLTGHLPYAIDERNPAQTVQTIATEPPTPLEARGVRPGADLEAVVLKALEKNAVDRYASVASLRDDLERCRTGQPVSARPQTLSYVLSRLVARHKVRFTLAAIGVLMLIAICAALTMMSIALDAERQAAVAARDDAEKRLAETVEHAGYIMNTVVQRLGSVPDAEEICLTMARDVHDIFADLAPRYPDHLPVQKRYWESLRLLAGMYAARGEREMARELLIDSHELVARAVQSNPDDPDVRFQHAYSLRHLAGYDSDDAARERLEESVRILTSLARSHPQSAIYHRELGASLRHLSNCAVDEAEKRTMLERAAHHYARACEIDPEAQIARAGLAAVRQRLEALGHPNDEGGE